MAEDAERYVEHQADTGVRAYREMPGHVGALVLRGDGGDLVEVTTVSFWGSMEAVKAFAGEEPDQAKFYPGDDELLAEKYLHVDHFEVASAEVDVEAMNRGIA